MKLTIQKSELEIIKEESVYNNNVYRVPTGHKMRIICDENYNTYDFYLVREKGEVFIGGCENYGETIIVDFLVEYT